METWIFKNEVVQGHSLYANCRSTLNEISNRDYPNKDYFRRDIESLDLDTYEKQIHGQADQTVDAVIGICDFNNKRTSNPRLVCIELKIDIVSITNLSVSKFERKVSYSRTLLGSERNLEPKALFIFNDQMAPIATSWFKRQQKSAALKQLEPCALSDFARIVKSFDEIPYQPHHNEQAIRKNLTSLMNNKQWNLFLKEIELLCKDAGNCQYHEPYEFEFLHHLIHELWHSFRADNPSLPDGNDELNAQIIEEDYSLLLQDL